MIKLAFGIVMSAGSVLAFLAFQLMPDLHTVFLCSLFTIGCMSAVWGVAGLSRTD